MLADIEPTVVNIFYMPVGTDLEFCSDETGSYFVDTSTGKEIRERVKSPMQIAFEKNLKFINQEKYPKDFLKIFFLKVTGSNHLLQEELIFQAVRLYSQILSYIWAVSMPLL